MTKFYQTRLDNLIGSFLRKELPFEEFQLAYSSCYIDEEADRDFRPDEVAYYGDVHDKSEWTADAPASNERDVGWLDVNEFRGWLEQHRSGRGH